MASLASPSSSTTTATPAATVPSACPASAGDAGDGCSTCASTGTGTTTTSSAAASTHTSDGRVLLQNPFQVLRYDIELAPDLTSFRFDGRCRIGVQLSEPATRIQLHAKELQIASARAECAGQDAVESSQIELDEEATVATIAFPSALPPGPASIALTFTGTLNDDMAGFYRSKYTDAGGQKKYMASTQFEPLDARRAFPCVDEPSAKAVFSVTLVVPAHLTALSNMPEASVTTQPDGRRRVLFQDTPKMSTYILAFCVGEFDFLEDTAKNGVKVRVYAPPGRAEQGRFSLDCACRALVLYDDFFGVPYPLPKLDMIAIPEFAAGAMENWGLVTYREIELLIDAAKASPQQRQRVCIVITHELAHMWFGNLVTMGWWCDLWLNEGFASFMENLAADVMFPQWKIWDQFVEDTLTSALQLDELVSSHPIQVPIAHAEEVEEVFDSISYSKGASVVRMLYEVVGPEAFRAGVRLYMKCHAYGNTETKDLWAAFEESSGLPVRKMMSSWTEQKGFPLLRVLAEQWDDQGVTLSLQQSWFLVDGSGPSREEKPLWTVPVIAGTAAKPEPAVQLHDAPEFEVKIAMPAAAAAAATSPSSWIKLNFGHAVPLRVAYTPALLNRLFEGVRSKTLPAVDRAGLLLDMFALCTAGVQDVEQLFRLLACFAHEDDATAWKSIKTVVDQLDAVLGAQEDLAGTAMHKRFEHFVARLASPAAGLVGWEPSPSDDHLGKLRRAAVIGLAGFFCPSQGDMAHKAAEYFQRITADPSSSTACANELRGTVLKLAAHHGGAAEHEALMRIYAQSQTDADRKIVLQSLGFVPDTALKTSTMEWALTSDQVKLQDCFYPFASVAHSSHLGQMTCWNFFKSHYEQIAAKVGHANPHMMEAFIDAACGQFMYHEQADEVEAFFKSKELPQNQRCINQTIENIRLHAAFLQRLRSGPAFTSPDFFDKIWTGKE